MHKNKNNISIEEGIEKLKELSLSENNKNDLNKEKSTDKNSITNNNIFNLSSNIKFQKTIPNIYKKKRKYITLLTSSEKFSENQNKNGAKNTINFGANNINQNNKSEKNNQKLEKEKAIKRESGSEEHREKEKNKIELKNVDIIAEELIKSKNEEELKKYLFEQLQLLDNKKRNEKNKVEIKYIIKQLDKDKIDLRKCNIGVSRALNKKIVEYNHLDREIKNLEKNINNIKNSIKYYESLGDCYKEELKKLKSV